MWSCGYIKNERGQDVVAECCGQVLTLDDIRELTAGCSAEDSARIADEYIKSWAVELLMYEGSHRVDSRKIEALVEDYRRSLYVYEYEQLLLAQRMSQEVSDSMIRSYYEQNKHHFILRETLLKGALVILPKDAPKIENLHRHLSTLNKSESLEAIEKYVYQYGVGYELFVNEWKPSEAVIACMPIELADLDRMLAKNKLIEVRDSLNSYLFQVVDFRSAGSVMPLDYARKDIEANILGARSKEFIRKTRQELYDKSVKNGKLKRYEN
jgi:hypothetical protein